MDKTHHVKQVPPLDSWKVVESRGREAPNCFGCLGVSVRMEQRMSEENIEEVKVLEVVYMRKEKKRREGGGAVQAERGG
ncbi:hypothetical protein PAMP_016967 [Pampus punctatissimus]